MPARYLAVFDVGTTVIKAALIAGEPNTPHQQVIAYWLHPTQDVIHSLTTLYSHVQTALTHQPAGEVDIAIIGDIPAIPDFPEIKWHYTQTEALTAVAKRLSSSATVVVIDIGSRNTQVALGKYGKVSLETFNSGVGEQAWNFLREADHLAHTQQWLTAALSDNDIENYFATKGQYPEMVPYSQEELAMEQALAKAILQDIARQLPFPWSEVKSIIATGGVLGQIPVATQTVSMVLDGLAPTGIMQVVIDPSLLAITLGGACLAWSADDYRIGRGLLHQALKPVGTIVGLPVNPNHATAKITLDTGLSQPQLLEVHAGDLLQLPLPETDPGEVSLKIDKTQTSDTQLIVGGEAGVVIDSRGRPVQIPIQANERRVKLLLWDRQLNAHHQYGTFGGSND